jgi:hypothetical protein
MHNPQDMTTETAEPPKSRQQKILAIGQFTTPPTPEQIKEIFPKEVPATQKLYLDSKIDQLVVSRISASLADGSPEGWLCTSTKA